MIPTDPTLPKPTLQDHPIAAMFPLLPEEELIELAASISRNGQRHPVIIYQGLILDGRNRARACAIAGVKPVTEIYDPRKHGTSVLQFVLDENLHKRHLTPSQRAMIAAEALKAMQAEAQAAATGKIAPAAPIAKPKVFGDGTLVEEDEVKTTAVPTQAEMAHGAGVSERQMSTAMKVTEDAGEAAKVVAGEKSLSQAEADIEKKNQEAAAAKEATDRKIQDARRAFIKRIRTVCGEPFAQAFIDNEVLKTQKEAAAFLALDDETMKKVAPLVATGWAVKKAASHVTRAITGATTLDELINRAISEKGTLIFKHNGHEVAITKLEK